jgi:hypothetical protein
VNASTASKASVRSSILGQSDFSLMAQATSEYDLKEAAKRYKFALVPKVIRI